VIYPCAYISVLAWPSSNGNVTCSQLYDVDHERQASVALKHHTCRYTFTPGLRAGNLEDITLRAVRVLRAADLVLAEDTRRTRQLLSHLDIRGASLTSFHEHNERGKQEQVPASPSSGCPL